MTAYRAIAGYDIRPKMVVVLKPGAKPFEVDRVEDAGLVLSKWVYLYDADGQKACDGAIDTTRWYAEVPS